MASGMVRGDGMNGPDIEKVMWTGVADCPNNYAGPCGFIHTCVTWNNDGTVAGPPGTRSVLVGRVSTVPNPDGVTA